MLKIELDSVKVWRNKNEYQNTPRARCGNQEVVGHGMIVAKLCADLASLYASDELVEVWRGDMLCFHRQTLAKWAASN